MARARTKTNGWFPAISFRQPSADLIVGGARVKDRRSRPTRFRGWILIHASSGIDRDAVSRSRNALGLARDADYDPERGKILGLAQLADCVKNGDGWTYVWAKPRRFPIAIPCRGHYSIPFYVPASLVRGTPAEKVTPGKLEE